MRTITRREFLRTSSAGAAVAGIGALTAGGSGPLAAQAAAPSPLPHRQSFCFLHSYEATGRYWRGLEKAGLLRPGNGVRLVNSPWGDDTRRFNAVARVGGPLHQILRGAAAISSSIAWWGDLRIIRTFSMPNWLSIMRPCWAASSSAARCMKRCATFATTGGDLLWPTGDSPANRSRPEKLRSWFNWSNEPHWLEYGTLDDYAGRVRPGSPHCALAGDRARGEDPGVRGFTGDSPIAKGAVAVIAKGLAARLRSSSAHGEHVWHIFYGFGAACCLAEIGVDASHQAQFAIASLRGAARAAGKPWGVFFAPWGPKGVTCFIPAKDQSWQTGESSANGQHGPSSALQRRIFFHAFLSGAHTLHEEWGAEGNLLDWEEGKISSYGKVTRDLLDFQEAHPDVGEPYTPIALVLDAAVPPADASPWGRLKQRLFERGDADRTAAARKGSGEAEADCYAPCALPEVFDIVPSDAPRELWRDYRRCDPGGDGGHPARRKGLPAGRRLRPPRRRRAKMVALRAIDAPAHADQLSQVRRRMDHRPL